MHHFVLSVNAHNFNTQKSVEVGEGTPYSGLYGEATPESGALFRHTSWSRKNCHLDIQKPNGLFFLVLLQVIQVKSLENWCSVPTLGFCKLYHFLSKGKWKGFSFCQSWHIKGTGLEQLSLCKISLSTPGSQKCVNTEGYKRTGVEYSPLCNKVRLSLISKTNFLFPAPAELVGIQTVERNKSVYFFWALIWLIDY